MEALAGYDLEDFKIRFRKTSKKATAEILESVDSLKENNACENGGEERDKGGEYIGHAVAEYEH